MIRFDLSQSTHRFEPDSDPPLLSEISERTTAVAFAAGDDVEILKPFLKSLKIIIIVFPSFRDGRGFTHARTLREYHRFSGDLCADGEILPDQACALKRVGFDAVILKTEDDLKEWVEHTKPLYPFTYQQKLFETR